jgi:RecJ-like exonuclease
VGPGVFSDLQAAAHVGEVATIVGTVVTVVRSRAGNIYLNFGADYPHQTFSAAVLNPGGAGFDELERLAGRRVRVTGMIKRHQGRVEIVILKPEQLTIMP